MSFKELTPEKRVIAVHTDMLRHPDFCILGSVAMIGEVKFVNVIPTAGTDSVDVYYNPKFIEDMSRKQLRYLVAHEQMHKVLHHCTEYRAIKLRYPKYFAMAIDYVANCEVERLDTKKDFVERPTNVPPLIDPKYDNKSVPEVVRMLIEEHGQTPPPIVIEMQCMDEHMDPQKGEGEGDPQEGDGDGDGEPKEGEGRSGAEVLEMQQAIDKAVIQGEIVQQQLRKMRGDQAGNRSLSGFRDRTTDWRGPLRRFITEIGEGDEQSRFNPPNKRFLPLGIIMPSHFDEAMEELLVACDTSGSMTGVYPIVFGEIANICKTVLPKRVRVLWWDTRVAGEQVFTPQDFDKIKDLMKPAGGGGTTVSCVAQYVRQKQYKPKAVIYLSDGYIEACYDVVPGNVLWGIVGNPGFVPLRGKKLDIAEE